MSTSVYSSRIRNIRPINPCCQCYASIRICIPFGESRSTNRPTITPSSYCRIIITFPGTGNRTILFDPQTERDITPGSITNIYQSTGTINRAVLIIEGKVSRIRPGKNSIGVGITIGIIRAGGVDINFLRSSQRTGLWGSQSRHSNGKRPAGEGTRGEGGGERGHDGEAGENSCTKTRGEM